MPRQPYMSLSSLKKGTEINVGQGAIGQRPNLEKLIGDCIMAWPHVEAEMALFLGQLIGTDNPASLTVFQVLRRSSSQREAISEAAKVILDTKDQELISAILNVHKAIEAERNALVHGHFGTSSDIMDGILWMNAADYISIRMILSQNAARPEIGEEKLKLLSRVWVYKDKDLQKVFNDIKKMATIWLNSIDYLRLPPGSDARAGKYRQLCGQSHIARELETLRQKNTTSTPTQSRKRDPSAEC